MPSARTLREAHVRSPLPTWPSHTASKQAGPHALLVWAQNTPAGPKTKQNLFKIEHWLSHEPTSCFGKCPMEMESSLLLRAVKYVALQRWSPKPVGSENVCGLRDRADPATLQVRVATGRVSCFEELAVPHNSTWCFRDSRKGCLLLVISSNDLEIITGASQLRGSGRNWSQTP